MRILLAEDNELARRAAAAQLNREGHDVVLAEDGVQALALARTHHPDFIISDVLMPRMDGFELCRALREDEQLHDIPLVFYSATFLDPEDEQLANSVGANGFIHKDSDPEQFRQRLHEFLEMHTGRAAPEVKLSGAASEEVQRLHTAALMRKLHRKVSELEAERQALADNQRFLHQVLTTIPDVVFAMKLPGLEPCFIAPEAERLIGFSAEELMGEARFWLALVHNDDRERIQQEIAQAVAARSKAVTIGRMRHKRGGYRWIEARFSLRLDDAGTPIELIGSLSDISVRYEIEQQLRESERSLNTLLHNLPGMAYRCDNSQDWRMHFISEGVEALTGYRREMLLHNAQLSYAELIVPVDRERIWNEVQQALAERRQFNVSYRICHRDGTVRWVWERGTGLFDEAGQVLCIEGFISDITQRKRAEDELMASERRYRNLFEMMESGMAVHELVYDASGKAVDFRFLAINPAFERHTGLKGTTIVGRTARQVMPDIDAAWIGDYIHVAQSGEPARFVRYRESLERYFDVIVYRNEENQFVTLFTDMTEQRRAEEQINNLARFPQENPSPVLRVDAAGRLLYANPAYSEMVNAYREDSSVESGCAVLVQAARDALQSGEIGYLDVRADSRYYSFVIRPVLPSGYANLYGLEITERVEAARQLTHLNRVLRTLTKGNRTLVHATSEEELLSQICAVLVEQGGYPYVWLATKQSGEAAQVRYQAGRGSNELQKWISRAVQSTQLTAQLERVVHDMEPILVGDSLSGVNLAPLQGYSAAALPSALLLLPIMFKESRYGVLGIFADDESVFDRREMALLNEMAGDVAFGLQAQRIQQAHEQNIQRLQRTMLQTIEAVSLTLEKRDPYTAGHQQRVAHLAVAIAQAMGLSAERIEGLRLAALVHDIGKIYVPAEILNRPGRLSAPELGIIRSHPEVGYDILKRVDFDWPIAEMVLQHHERCDGSGYPRGLKRNKIILEARILAVADVVEAITSHRPYRPSLGLDIALREIVARRKSHFDADVVDTCLRLFTEERFSWEHGEPLQPLLQGSYVSER